MWDYYDRLNTQKKSLWNNTERSQQEKECYDRFDAEFRRSASLNNERNIFNNPIRRFDDRQFRLNDIEIDEDFYFIENNNKKLEINTEEDDRDKRDFCTDFKQDLYNNFEYDKDEHLSSSYSKFSDNDENTNKKDSENKSTCLWGLITKTHLDNEDEDTNFNRVNSLKKNLSKTKNNDLKYNFKFY